MNANEATAVINDFWAERKYPDEERMLALKWAGSLERLAKWFQKDEEEILEIRRRLQVRSYSDEEKAQVVAEAERDSALVVSRRTGIPIIVIWYWLDGSPKIDTFRRPWLPRRK